MWTVSTSSTVPVLKLENDALKKALAVVGVRLVVYTTDGTPSSWVNGMNQALGHGADLIVLEGVDPHLVLAQVKQAKADHVPVIWDWAVEGPVSKVGPNLVATNPLPFKLGAKLLADLAIVKANGNANVELLGVKTQRQDSVYIDGVKAELKAKCSACNVKGYTNVPVPDWNQKLTQETQNIIRRNPSVNTLLAFYDGMVEFVVPGVRQANATGRVRIITHDGTPAVLSQVKQKAVAADVGVSRRWLAWACADQVLRVLTGTRPLETENIPARVWTSTDINQATGPHDEKGYGESYIPMYKKLWKVTG